MLPLKFLTCNLILSSAAAFVVPKTATHRMYAAARVMSLAMTQPPSSDQSEEQQYLKHTLTYSVTGTGRGSLVNMQNASGQTMATDIPKKFGGTELAPTPVETLLAALIGCEQATAVYVGRSMNPRLLIERIDFDLQMDRDARGALELPIEKTPDISACPKNCYGKATVYLSGKEKTIPPEQLRLLKEQTEARCPVANMIRASGCPVDISWIDGNNVEI